MYCIVCCLYLVNSFVADKYQSLLYYTTLNNACQVRKHALGLSSAAYVNDPVSPPSPIELGVEILLL